MNSQRYVNTEFNENHILNHILSEKRCLDDAGEKLQGKMLLE